MHIPGYSRIQSYSVVFTCPEKLFWVQSLKVLWRIELCSCRFLLFPVFLVTFLSFFVLLLSACALAFGRRDAMLLHLSTTAINIISLRRGEEDLFFHFAIFFQLPFSSVTIFIICFQFFCIFLIYILHTYIFCVIYLIGYIISIRSFHQRAQNVLRKLGIVEGNRLALLFEDYKWHIQY